MKIALKNVELSSISNIGGKGDNQSKLIVGKDKLSKCLIVSSIILNIQFIF
jgi:hypothetical protein